MRPSSFPARPLGIAVRRDDDCLGTRFVERGDTRVLVDLDSGSSRARGEAADEARGLEHPVRRMEDRRWIPVSQGTGQLVTPLHVEPVGTQGRVLLLELRSLLPVCGDP